MKKILCFILVLTALLYLLNGCRIENKPLRKEYIRPLYTYLVVCDDTEIYIHGHFLSEGVERFSIHLYSTNSIFYAENIGTYSHSKCYITNLTLSGIKANGRYTK